MAISNWPSGLPKYFQTAGFQRLPKRQAEASPNEKGKRKLHRSRSRLDETIQGVMRMTATQVATLKQFYSNDLAGGSLPFMLPDPDDPLNATLRVIFNPDQASPYDPRPALAAPGKVDVTLFLETA